MLKVDETTDVVKNTIVMNENERLVGIIREWLDTTPTIKSTIISKLSIGHVKLEGCERPIYKACNYIVKFFINLSPNL